MVRCGFTTRYEWPFIERSLTRDSAIIIKRMLWVPCVRMAEQILFAALEPYRHRRADDMSMEMFDIDDAMITSAFESVISALRAISLCNKTLRDPQYVMFNQLLPCRASAMSSCSSSASKESGSEGMSSKSTATRKKKETEMANIMKTESSSRIKTLSTDEVLDRFLNILSNPIAECISDLPSGKQVSIKQLEMIQSKLLHVTNIIDKYKLKLNCCRIMNTM